MRIAIDAMGGDFAPAEIIKGAIKGASEYGVNIVLVGQENIITRELMLHNTEGINIDIVHTDEFIVEGEHPAYALRSKRNASILLATKLVKTGEADAVVSAGPTGAVVAAALSVLGAVEGFSRPVFGGTFLGELSPHMFASDLGGNVDVRPHQLLDFAVVGVVYMRKMFGIESPTVALLSNGAEEGKGNELTKAAIPLFKRSGLNFIGCVEGHDLLLEKANVVVCDAFVGNVMVKFCEGLGKSIIKCIEKELDGKLPVAEIDRLTEKIFISTNSAEARGGGPLLAVNGIACKSHGRARADEFSRVIGQAKLFCENNLVSTLKAELAAVKNKIGQLD